MSDTVTFEDPPGWANRSNSRRSSIPADLPDAEIRRDQIPEPDPYYVDLGMLYRLAALEEVRGADFDGIPLHLALRGHMGTGKDHDLEQFAALLRLPYYRIPLTGEVRDITLIGSIKLHGDGKGGTESRWEDGDITRALRGPALDQHVRAERGRCRDPVRSPRPPRPLPGARTPDRRDGAPPRRRPGLRDAEPHRSAGLCRHPDPQQGLRRPLGHLGEGVSPEEQIEAMLEGATPT